MAEEPLEAERQVEEPPLALAAVPQLAQPRLHLEGLLEREVLALLGLRVELRDAVGLREGEVEDAAHVLDRRLPLERAEGDDLCHVVGAVLLAHVADHLVAAHEAEVDVDVGHLLALGVEKALEEEPVLDGVEVGDAQRVGDQAAGGRAAPRADRDALGLRPVDEVGDDQEVAREAHGSDDAELEGEPLLVDALAHRAPAERPALVQALVEALASEAVEHPLAGLPRRHLVDRELLAVPQRELAAPGDLDGVGDRLGHVGEGCGHLGGVLHVELVGLEAPAPLVGERLAGLDAEERLVRGGVLGAEVVAVVGGDEGEAHLACERDQLPVHALLRRQAVVLDLDVEATVEDAGQLLGRAARPLRLPVGQVVGHLAAETARERDQPPAELAQQLLVDARLVVEALAIAGGDQLAEVAVALAAHREQDQVVVAARLVVVDAARLLEAALRRHVHLAADDRLHVRLPRRLVELHRPEHVAVVGDGARRHSRAGDARQQLGDLVGAVEQRVLRVEMQVDEGHRPGPLLNVPSSLGVSAHGSARGRRASTGSSTPGAGSDGRVHDDLAREHRQNVLPRPQGEAGGLDLPHHVAHQHVEPTADLARVESPHGPSDLLKPRAIAVGDEQLPARDAPKLVENHPAPLGSEQMEQAEADDHIDAPILEREGSGITLEEAEQLAGIVLCACDPQHLAGDVRGDDVHRHALEQAPELASAARDVQEDRARRVDFTEQPGDQCLLPARDDSRPEVLRREAGRVLGLVPSRVLPAPVSIEELVAASLLPIGASRAVGRLHPRTLPRTNRTRHAAH